MDNNHFSLIDPVCSYCLRCHRYALGFDSEVRLFVIGAPLLGLGMSWNFFVMPTFFRRSLSWTSEGHVTSGFSLNIGCCVCACIMLAINTGFAVASMSLLFDQPIRVGQPVEHVVTSGSGEVLSLTRIRFACLACHLHILSHLG